MKHYKKLEFPRKIRLWRKRLYHSKSVKYRGVRIGENLNWKDDIATKLTANSLLYEIKNCLNILKAICFVILDSNINYANLIWGKTTILS